MDDEKLLKWFKLDFLFMFWIVSLSWGISDDPLASIEEEDDADDVDANNANGNNHEK